MHGLVMIWDAANGEPFEVRKPIADRLLETGEWYAEAPPATVETAPEAAPTIADEWHAETPEAAPTPLEHN